MKPHQRMLSTLPVASVARFCAVLFLAAVIAAPMAQPARALSEIKREELPPPGTTPPEPAPGTTIPTPEATTPPASPTPETPAPDNTAPADGEEGQVPDEPASAGEEPDAPLPEIQYDVSTLPEPVQQTRKLIIEAVKTGDIEKLRPLLGTGEEQTQLSLGGVEGDPIKFLRELSGDSEGQEILAIIEEVMSAGFVHMDPGTQNDFYVWPYFFAIPLDKLSAAQRVELFKIVTAGDYEDMKTYGAYIFYRIGITPAGKWSFFIAGD